MTAVRVKCWVCEDHGGLLYEVRDITRPGAGAIGQLGCCDRCRDVIATGWVSLHLVGVMEPARP
jgi:hypothetical protein